jgi:hypothetical protein
MALNRTCAKSRAGPVSSTLGIPNFMREPIPLSARIRGFFARDKRAFWWSHFTDEEKKLRRMDVWQLAKAINEARVRNLAGEVEKLIVAEHMLNVRLAQIQAKASWGSGILGFVGAIIGSALSVSLTIALQSPKEVQSAIEANNKKQAVAAPIQKQREPIAQAPKNEPRNNVVEIASGTQGAVNGPSNSANTKHHNAATNP